MRLRAHATSIALALLAAGAVVYAYVGRGSVTEAEKKTREGSVFAAWRREELARIVIDHGAEHIALERTKDDAGDAEWWLRAPRGEKADAESADKLAAALEFASVARKVDPGASVPGWDAPRARGEVAMGALTYRFTLGGEAPTPPGSAYLRLDGAGTVVVGRDLVTALLAGADTYRSRAVVPYLSIELARLDVKSATGAVAIERADDVSFKLAPSGLRASRSKLDVLWGALAEARAEAFLPDAVADGLVASPRVSITMTPKGGRTPGLLRVGDACPGNADDVAVVRDAPTRLSACAPKGILAGLGMTEAELVDTHLFAAHDDEVAELRIESLAPPARGGAIELARKENGWRERSPAERDLTGEAAEAAASLVTLVAGAEGSSPRASGKEEPFAAVGRVTLRRADGDTAEVVELGPPDAAGDVPVRRLFDGARLRVAAAVARNLTPRAVAFRGREPWTPRIEGAPVASIETRCEGLAQRATHDGDSWTMRTPAGFGVDNATVLGVIDAVTRARVESWAADVDDGHFGFGAPPCFIALTLRLDGGDRVARIELGSDGEGGIYARTADDPGVFVAPVALRERARTWLVDLHGLVPAEVLRVTLERGGKRLSFGADAGEPLGADAVLAAASVLRADSVVHLGAALADEGFARPSLVLTASGGSGARRVVFGRDGLAGTAPIVYARVDGVDATFAVDRDRTRPFLERF
jgi:hypothetical protein